MNTEQLKTIDLHFDRQNPRLAEYGILPTTSEEELLKILWNEMDVMELVQSICASGFFQHEALIVVEENDKMTVIEGNRRLAALKTILHPEIAKKEGWNIPSTNQSIIESLKDVPCLRSSRSDAWKYLGFKHVNGPAKWSSYAKAAYIAKVHRDFGVPLAQIASQIGDRHNTVQRLYRGLMVLEQAEKSGSYDREDRWNNRLFFSHLYTGLDREGIRNFLQLAPKEDESQEPVSKGKLKELGELCVWLYGSKKEKNPPLINNQNPDLKHLDEVIANREALSALRATRDLDAAHELSRPSGAVFEESLLAAKRALAKAQSHLTTGFDTAEDLLKIAETVADMADDLVVQMKTKMKGTKRRRREEI